MQLSYYDHYLFRTSKLIAYNRVNNNIYFLFDKNCAANTRYMYVPIYLCFRVFHSIQLFTRPGKGSQTRQNPGSSPDFHYRGEQHGRPARCWLRDWQTVGELPRHQQPRFDDRWDHDLCCSFLQQFCCSNNIQYCFWCFHRCVCVIHSCLSNHDDTIAIASVDEFLL